MNWQRYTDKQGNEVHAKQWFGRNLRAILKDLYITFTENDLLKFEKRGHFWIRHGRKTQTKVIRGDWIVKDTDKILSFNTKLFNEIFKQRSARQKVFNRMPSKPYCSYI